MLPRNGPRTVPAYLCLPLVLTEQLACPSSVTGGFIFGQGSSGHVSSSPSHYFPPMCAQVTPPPTQRHFHPLQSQRATGMRTPDAQCALPSQGERSLVGPHSIMRSSPIGGTGGAGPLGLSHPSVRPSETSPGGYAPVLSCFPSWRVFHSRSTVKPQQLPKPTAQRGARSSPSLITHPTCTTP